MSPIFGALEDLYVSTRLFFGFKGIPRFLIIGAQKSGTTSLYNEIVSHPDVHETFRKEIVYFNIKHTKYSINWYFANFPSSGEYCFGEATPDYLFDINAPSIISKYIPNVRLIVILRDPVERAVSQYFHEKRLGREKLPLKLALEKEDARLRSEYFCIDDPAASYSFRERQHFFSYSARGKYGEQLTRWLKFFPREQFHVIHFEDFKHNSSEALKTVFTFLDLAETESCEKISNENIGVYDQTLNIDLDSFRQKFADDQALLSSLGFSRIKNDV